MAGFSIISIPTMQHSSCIYYNQKIYHISLINYLFSFIFCSNFSNICGLWHYFEVWSFSFTILAVSIMIKYYICIFTIQETRILNLILFYYSKWNNIIRKLNLNTILKAFKNNPWKKIIKEIAMNFIVFLSTFCEFFYIII